MEAMTFDVRIHKATILNANKEKGKHWGSSHEQIQTLRQLGSNKARQLPRYQRVRITALVSYPDRIGRDVMNLYPVMKAYVDGMVNGMPQYTMKVDKNGKLKKRRLAPDPNTGILPDDNDRYLIGPHMEWSGELSGHKDHYLFRVKLEALEPMELENERG